MFLQGTDTKHGYAIIKSTDLQTTANETVVKSTGGNQTFSSQSGSNKNAFRFMDVSQINLNEKTEFHVERINGKIF